MIKIESLTKIYRSGNDVTALKDFSTTINSQGMVFVVGKSGSGKSTLLNILGGLDKATSGSVYADNYNLTDLDESELEKYRNSYLGFIFQDFCLVDSLNVYDNVKLSLDINNDNNLSKIDDVLKQVELEEYKHRYPRELSAGQKQRVAIARAIVKKPRLILCDEPTGNLDSKTGKQILNILKELSKDALVIIVSHNLDDAYNYADRIIEIKDGCLSGDIGSDNQDDYLIKDKTLYLSNVSSLDDHHIDDINKQIKDGGVTSIKKKKDLFIKQKEVEFVPSDYQFNNSKLSMKRTTSLLAKISKRKWLSLAVTSLLVGLLTTVFGLSQAYISFSSDKIVEEALRNNSQSSFVMQKGYYPSKTKQEINTYTLVAISDSDKQLIDNSSYNDKYYSLYNYSLPVSLRYWQLSNQSNISNSGNLSSMYLQEIYGVLPCDDSFINQLFPNYKDSIVGDMNDKSYGIAITDFIADSILFYRGERYSSYEDILGTYSNKSNSVYAYINAIIKTDYKNKHSQVVNTYTKYLNDPDSVDLDTFLTSDAYIAFYEDVKSSLGIAYTINPHFVSDMTVKEARNIVTFNNSIVNTKVDNKNVRVEIDNAWGFVDSAVTLADLSILHLPDNTMGVSLSQLNNMFHTSYTYEQALEYLDGNEITLSRTNKYHEDDTPLFTRKMYLKVYDTGMFNFAFSEDLFSYLRSYDMIPYSLYFKNISKANIVYHLLKDVPYVANSSYIEAGVYVNNAVHVFSNFFVLITVLLLSILLITLVAFSYISIREQKYNIGVFKSLGMRNKDISKLFMIQIIFTGLVSSLVYTIGLLIFTKVSNNLLVDSFMNIMKNPAIKHISVISYHPWVFIVDILIIIVISLIAALLPMLVMKRYKPIEIIRKSSL